jgi:hypothetical protein
VPVTTVASAQPLTPTPSLATPVTTDPSNILQTFGSGLGTFSRPGGPGPGSGEGPGRGPGVGPGENGNCAALDRWGTASAVRSRSFR